VDLLNRRQPVRVVVVVEGQEAVGRRHSAATRRRAVDAHETVDVAVVADDGVGVVGMTRQRRVARVVAARVGAGAAEDQVGRVRTQRRGDAAEQARAATDDVVLAVVAEQNVGAAAALDVVVSVARGLE
jgi:hypothetical protein